MNNCRLIGFVRAIYIFMNKSGMIDGVSTIPQRRNDFRWNVQHIHNWNHGSIMRHCLCGCTGGQSRECLRNCIFKHIDDPNIFNRNQSNWKTIYRQTLWLINDIFESHSGVNNHKRHFIQWNDRRMTRWIEIEFSFANWHGLFRRRQILQSLYERQSMNGQSFDLFMTIVTNEKTIFKSKRKYHRCVFITSGVIGHGDFEKLNGSNVFKNGWSGVNCEIHYWLFQHGLFLNFELYSRKRWRLLIINHNSIWLNKLSKSIEEFGELIIFLFVYWGGRSCSISWHTGDGDAFVDVWKGHKRFDNSGKQWRNCKCCSSYIFVVGRWNMNVDCARWRKRLKIWTTWSIDPPCRFERWNKCGFIPWQLFERKQGFEKKYKSWSQHIVFDWNDPPVTNNQNCEFGIEYRQCTNQECEIYIRKSNIDAWILHVNLTRNL